MHVIFTYSVERASVEDTNTLDAAAETGTQTSRLSGR